MRKALKLLAPVSLLALAACSEASEESAVFGNAEVEAAADTAAPSEMAAAEEPAAATSRDEELAALAGTPDIPFTLPRIAYAYDLGFRLAGEKIVPLQQEHADMCEALGPANCRIVLMNSSGELDEEIRGELELAVAADKARAFTRMLSGAATEAGAEGFKANIQGEDLSKSIVDTEARLRSREALRDRLLEVVETRRGKLEELVEAERQVAAINEEIDAARSWLTEQKGRVAFSRVAISYETATPGASFTKPIEGVIGSLGGIFGVLIAGLILMLALLGPMLAGVLGVRALRRRARPEAA